MADTRTTASRTRSIRLAIRIAISAALFIAFTLHIQGALRLELIECVENYLYDVRVRLSLISGTDNRIVIIDIDEESLAAEGQWPCARRCGASRRVS